MGITLITPQKAACRTTPSFGVFTCHEKPCLRDNKPTGAQVLACRGPRLVLGFTGALLIIATVHGLAQIARVNQQYVERPVMFPTD